MIHNPPPARTVLKRSLVLGAIGLALSGGFLSLASCSERAPDGQGAQGAGARRVGADVARPGQRVYVVRAKIVSLPRAGENASELKAQHEAIDDFVDADGKVTGMNAMVMDFPLAAGVSADALKVGDPVRLTFRTWIDTIGTTRVLLWEATKFEALPADTTIEMRRADPTRGASTGASAPAPK